MPRFNFTNITLNDDADIIDVVNNFNEIEQKAALLTDLTGYQTKSAQSNTINSSSTNDTYPGSAAVFGSLAIEKLTSTLALVNGTDLSLTMSKYYRIPSLTINGTIDNLFNNSIIYVYKSGTETMLELIDGPNVKINNPLYLMRRYYYHGGSWVLTTNKYIQYGTSNMQDGVTPLPTGALYFQYE